MGLLFLILYPAPAPVRPVHLCHTPSVTHRHTPSLSHTIFHTPSLSHTIFHTPSFLHTTLSHTIFHHTIFNTHLCHTPSFTHHFVTHHFVTHHLSHTMTSPSFHVAGASLCVAGVLWWRAWVRFSRPGRRATLHGRRGAWWHWRSFSVAVYFAWQAWHLVTSTFHLRGRCGTWRHPPSLCVAGVVLMARGWLWWRAWARFSRPGRRATLRGRRGTWWHWRAICVAGVVLMALGWLWWRFCAF